MTLKIIKLMNYLLKISDFNDKLSDNSYYYSKDLIDNYLEFFNATLIKNNIYNISIDVNNEDNSNNFNIYFYSQNKTPITIEITGNAITKNETIRSKILIELVNI